MKTQLNPADVGRPACLTGKQWHSRLLDGVVHLIGHAKPRRETVSWSLISRYWPFYGLIFLIGTENFIVSPFIPAMAREVGLAVEALATVVTAYAFTYAFAAPFLGQVSDRIGSRLLIAIGGSVFLAGNVFFAAAPSLGMLQLARGVTGLGGAAAGPAIWSFIAATTPVDLRGGAMGLGMGAFALGQVVGMPVGGLVAGLFGWRWVFGGIGLLMIPLLFAACSNRSGALISTPNKQGRGRFPILAVWNSPAVLLTFLATFLFQVGNLGAYTYLGSLLSAQFSLSTSQIGVIGVLVGGGSLVGSFVGGKLNDHWRTNGGKSAHLAALWAFLLAFAVFATTSGWSLSISLVALTAWFVASGAFVTTQLTLVTLAAPTMRATAISWNNSIMFAGAGVGVWLIGQGLSRGISVGIVALCFGLAAAASTICLARFESAPGKENNS